MAITEAESGLTTGQYAALIAANDNPKWQVIAHKYNLDFEQNTTTESFIDAESDDWDACPSTDGDFFVMYSQGDLFVFLEDVESVSTPTKVATGLTNSAKSPSIVEDSGVAYVFTYDGTNIKRSGYNVSTSAISFISTGTQDPELESDEELTHIAAVTSTRFHYVVKDENNIYHLRVGTWGGDPIESDIYYMYPIQNFDAETNGDIDSIVIATQIPGTVSIRVVNDEVEKYVEAAGGVICFTYKDGNWSDHFDIDTVENANDWRMRRGPRITYMNGLFVSTSYSVAGTERFPFSSYRMYTSKDAKHWSIGSIMPIDEVPDRRGVKIVPVGDKVILCEGRNLYTSWSSDALGYSPTAVQVDITDDINDYSFVQDRGSQITINLDNSDGTYDSHAVISKDNTIMLEHFAGFGTNLIQIAITEIDYLDYDGDPRNVVIAMVGRDRMAWLSDKTQSEEAKYWEGQMIGVDRYQDYTKTRYGGMRHTATQSGSWDTVDSLLQLRSSNEEGISFNSFKSYIWNGSYQISFRLATLGNSEYAGIVFRAIDKDNKLEARYDEDTDSIKLIKTLGGSKSTLDTAISMGWDNLSWHHIKVEFRYAKIVVLASSDGITWVKKITHYQDGQHDPGTFGPVLLDNGYVGQVARGYSPPIDSDWSFPDFVIPDYFWTPPDFDLDSFEIEFAASDGVWEENSALVWNTFGEGAFSETFYDQPPTWKLVNPTEGSIKFMCFDHGSEYVVNDGNSGELGAYVLTADTAEYWVYYIPDLFADTLVYTELFTDTTAHDIGTGWIEQHDTDFDNVAFVLRTERGNVYGWTFDNGDNWTYGSSIDSFDDNNFPGPVKVLWAGSTIVQNQFSFFSDDAITSIRTSDETKIYKGSLPFTDVDRPLISKYDDTRVYMYRPEYVDNSVSYYPDLSIDPPPTINSNINYDTWISEAIRDGVGATGSYLQNGENSQSTRMIMATGDNSLHVNADFHTPFEVNLRTWEDHFLIIVESGSSNTGSITWNYELELKDGTVYERTGYYTLSGQTVSTDSHDGDIPPNESGDVAHIYMKLEITGFTTDGSLASTGLEVVRFEGTIVDINDYILQVVKDVSDVSDNVLTIESSVPSVIDDVKYTDYDSLSSSKRAYQAVSALAYEDGEIDQLLIRSTDGGSSWVKYDLTSDYVEVYNSPRRAAYLLGLDLVDKHRPFGNIDKEGNLDSIWTASWVATGMEVLE